MIMNELLTILNYISIYQGIFLGLILLNRKENKFSNNILSVILFSSALCLLATDLVEKELLFPVYLLTFIIFPLLLLYGPLIYFYTKSMTGGISRLSKKDIYHFIPLLSFVIYLLINTYFLYNKNSIFDDFISSSDFSYLKKIMLIYSTLIILLITIYIIVSWRILNLCSKEIREFFSDISGLRVLWLKNFLGILFIIFLINDIEACLSILHIKNSRLSQSFEVLNFCFIVVTAFFILRKPDIFKYTHEMLEELTKAKETMPEIHNKATIIKYAKSDIDNGKKDEYQTVLLKYMKKKKPYLKEDITLKDLADELSIPPHHLSIVINERLKQNFYNFINSYRVNDVIEKLCDPAHSEKNILNLAYESGFNSKATFNMAFKNITGKTPTEYKRSTNN